MSYEHQRELDILDDLQELSDKIEDLLDKGELEYKRCITCPVLVPQEKWDIQEHRCTGCYLDYRIGQRQQKVFEDQQARDPYLGNGTTEDRRRASRHETESKSSMF